MAEQKPYSFYKLLPDGRFEFHMDASLMKDFSLCEQYFYYKHVKNLRRKGNQTAKPFAMAIGSWWSDVMDMFYSQMRDHKPIERSHVQEIALQAWVKNELDESAKASPDQFEAFGDVAGAVLMLQEYYDSQYQIDVRGWDVVSIEQGFGLKHEVPVGETKKVVVYWVGKPDLTVIENGRLFPVDHKTVNDIQGRTIGLYKPSAQMTGYVYACEVIAKSLGIDAIVDRCTVNICARKRPTDKPRNGKPRRPRFIRAYPNFNREEIAEWRRQIVSRCERIAQCLQSGIWNWSETTCHNLYMRECDYNHADSKAPSVRDLIWITDYQVGLPWKPYDSDDTDS